MSRVAYARRHMNIRVLRSAPSGVVPAVDTAVQLDVDDEREEVVPALHAEEPLTGQGYAGVPLLDPVVGDQHAGRVEDLDAHRSERGRADVADAVAFDGARFCRVDIDSVGRAATRTVRLEDVVVQDAGPRA